jgi:hypothetical protein
MFFVMMVFTLIPVVSAHADQDPFPDVAFSVFNDFIAQQFSNDVSLKTVLIVLFTMTNNPDLLSLHAWQQHPKHIGEICQSNTKWIKALARALQTKLGNAANTVLNQAEQAQQLPDEQVSNCIGLKLDSLDKVLKLTPYDHHGQLLGKLKPISDQEIEPVQIIFPQSMECETSDCRSHAILNRTQERDVPKAELIKGTKILDNVPVLSGYCPQCHSGYHADHERIQTANNTWMKLYLNSATYLKVGQNVWVDCTFSSAVVNGTYSFHASSSAFTEFWNESFWKTQQTGSRKVSHHQVGRHLYKRLCDE